MLMLSLLTCLPVAVVGDPSPAVGPRGSAARGSAARRSPAKASKVAAADGPAALEGKFTAAAAQRSASEAAENDSANVAAAPGSAVARGGSKKKRTPLGVAAPASGPAFLQG